MSPPIYFYDREWADYVVYGADGDPHRHEGRLDQLFWEPKGEQVLCVLGDVGTGKSTLIGYYLRCHCPNQRPDEFAKKLIVWVDAKRFADPQTVRDQFYHAVKNGIEDAFTRAGRPMPSPQPGANVIGWVTNALKEITRSSGQPGSGYEYVVLVMDNLEQAHVSAQERIIRVIEEWRNTPQIKLWRIILPLWKSTFNSLRGRSHALLHNVNKFAVGPIRRKCHVERVRLCRNWLGGDDSLSAEDRARCTAYLDYCFEHLRPQVDRIVRLCGGDLRRQFRVIGEFLKSNAIHGFWASPRARMSEYEASLAVLCGVHDALAHDLTSVGNIFALGNAKEKPRDMLIGWHLLNMIGPETTRWNADRQLRRLGYAPENIRRGFDGLWKLNAFHQDMADVEERTEIVPHKPVIDEYIDLAADPAYVDAIAPVTPIDVTRLSALAAKLAGLNDTFVKKTEVALEFIRCVRADENEFLDVRRTRGDLNVERFDELLRGVRLPYLWVRMSERYRQRLDGLRRSGTLQGITDAQWDEWLGQGVLADAPTAPKLMTEALP